ncbi:hypothetical protein C0Z18_30790 [Trinickia dabaoshanensis]|uniref:Uncharacterized protein n=1 Tax=Trinickia dabaoshanensis TaxID=564714 RepID=A0A2N7VBU9_9BURK|nr:hypothetical protein [Trinickia dabaoshanensis]PMS14636.1 hypothetical protein C0Z18_30790 [Trinickia dabaoshanensis]
MENTLQSAGAVDGGPSGTSGVELTAAGRLLVVAAIAAAAFCGWLAYQRYDAAKASVAPATRASAAHATPVAPNSSATSGTNESTASKVAQLTEALQQERSLYGVRAGAWRSIADTSRQQIAALTSQLQAVESKIATLEKAAAVARVPHEAVSDVAASARAVHSALDAAKSTAQVDVASLPVENISAQSLNVTGLGNGVIQIGTRKLAVGQALTPGETIVAVDPVSRSIVTDRRILNVTN